jgi:hypothetical protein
MSKIFGSGSTVNSSQKGKEFSVQDTDFLLKLIMRSTFSGTELEQAYNVMEKIAQKHRRNLGHESRTNA